MGIFDFLRDDPYEDRVVERYEKGGLLVSTCRVNDGRDPYETGVAHPDYNDGHIIVVESYESECDARSGHWQWVQTMTTEPLPRVLMDCCNAAISSLGAAVGYDTRFERRYLPGRDVLYRKDRQ